MLRGSSSKTFIRFQSSIPTLSPTLAQIFKNPPVVNSKITVNGYIKSIRSLKKLSFLIINDNSTYESLTCVLPPLEENRYDTGQCISITGEFVESKGKQLYELKANDTDVKIIGDVPAEYPLQPKFHSLKYLRSLPSLRWKTSYLSSILRYRSNLEFKLAAFFQREGFFKVNPPIITSSDCEGAGELFKIESNSSQKKKDEKFFGKNAYLTVSTQLHLEVLCSSIGKVWTLSPIFRAEESDTSRHLSEFWMLEAEIAFVEDVKQLTKFSEIMIKDVVRELVNDKNISNDLLTNVKLRGDGEGLRGDRNVQLLEKRWNDLLSKEWDLITYDEAIKILKQSGKSFKIPVVYEDGLATEHEKWLSGEHFGNPVFVINYPKEQKPFYMKANADGTVACFDLLVPEIGELIGGSMREENLLVLRSKMVESNMNIEEMNWYLSTRENATFPHGGFGLGFERLVCYLTGVENIRDVIPFPRSSKECDA